VASKNLVRNINAQKFVAQLTEIWVDLGIR